MLRSIATLQTPTTHVEVSEARWHEPTEAISRLDRPTMCLLVFGPGYSAKGAFLDDRTLRVSKVGHVIFTPPDRDVLGRGTPGTMRVVACSFERSYCESIVGPLGGLSKSQLASCLDVHSPLLPALLRRLMTEALHPGFVSDAVVESVGQTMLVEWSHVVRAEETRHARGRLMSRHLKIIDDYLDALTDATPSVAAIARACGLSEGYFAKLFREHTGQSLGQYLKAAQMAKAQSYLLQTEMPLKEIAHRLGFKRPSNFSDAFRASTGETPGRFRSLNRPRSAAVRRQ
jgi:AraC family transcriptional regulator